MLKVVDLDVTGWSGVVAEPSSHAVLLAAV
jgi:hypothetical protein